MGPGARPNVFYNTGHGHLGWTLSAATADMLADMVRRAVRAAPAWWLWAIAAGAGGLVFISEVNAPALLPLPARAGGLHRPQVQWRFSYNSVTNWPPHCEHLRA